MARSNKVGIDYFSFDVDFFNDPKIEFISARFGTKGEIVAIRLLCWIYRENYFQKWSEDESILLAKRVGDSCTATLVRDVVHELVKRGFFDKGIFDRFEILTSNGIQKRYFEATRRYKKVDVYRELLLCDISDFDNVNIIQLNADINPINADINPQKEKEKEKEKEIINVKGNINRKNQHLFDLSFIPQPEFRELITDWIEYKSSRKEHYKSEKSIIACYNKLLKLSGSNPEVAKEILEQSYASNWQGFFELKTQNSNESSKGYRHFETKWETARRTAEENTRDLQERIVSSENR